MGEYDQANIIGARDVDEILLKHVLDSLSCLVFQPLQQAVSVVDVGTGGGLPGVPLKVARPSLTISLVESTVKKATFLRQTLQHFHLGDTTVLPYRAEDVGRLPGHRAAYDVATARAVASLAVIAEYCIPLVKVGGHVIAMKGQPARDEIEAGNNAAEQLGARISEIIDVPLVPGLGLTHRRLVILEKHSPTPEKYPRRTGVPKKTPLGR